MSYKMIVLDLDGTLLNDNKQISHKNSEILKKLHSKDIHIVIATGRNYYMAKSLIEEIKEIEPVILANNGAISRYSHNDENIDSKYLDSLEFEKIYNMGLKYNLNPVLHVDEYGNGFDLIYEKENYEEAYSGYIKKDYIRARLKEFNINKFNNILSVCYFDEYNKLSNFESEMDSLNNKNYNTICNRNISNRALLEFLHPEGCKWSSLQRYISRFNIKPEEIVAIGDDNNDIELLKNVGLGIAMVNGTEESKKAASKVSKYDNNNSGVFHELSEIFSAQL